MVHTKVSRVRRGEEVGSGLEEMGGVGSLGLRGVEVVAFGAITGVEDKYKR